MDDIVTPKPFNWFGHGKNILMALVLFCGGGAGSYVANSEMQASQAQFQAEVRVYMKATEKRLEILEEALHDLP